MDIIKELNVVEMELFVNSFTIPHRVEVMVHCHTLFEVLVKFWIVSQMREILNANKCDHLIFSISILIAMKYNQCTSTIVLSVRTKEMHYHTNFENQWSEKSH